MAGLTVRSASGGSAIPIGSKSNTGSLSVGSASGMQPTAPAYNVTLGQGTINQSPVSGELLGASANNTPPPTYTAPAPVGPTAAQTNPLFSALSSTDIVRDNAVAAARSLYDKNIAAYSAEDANDLANYQKQVGQNESNLAANRWAALLQAAQGGRGLRAVLGSLGALAGTGGTLADRAVTSAANKEVGEAGETFETNAETLNTAWQSTEREQRQRRAEAEAARDNDLMSAESNWATSRQGILTQLANLFGLGTGQGNTYASQAAELYPTIARGSRQNVAGYQSASPLYSEQALDTYKGGVSDLTVGARAGGVGNEQVINPLVATPTRRRDEEVI